MVRVTLERMPYKENRVFENDTLAQAMRRGYALQDLHRCQMSIVNEEVFVHAAEWYKPKLHKKLGAKDAE